MKKTSFTESKLTSVQNTKSETVDKLVIAAQEAVRAALREHKRAGNHVAVWKDGKVVLIPPEQIEA